MKSLIRLIVAALLALTAPVVASAHGDQNRGGQEQRFEARGGGRQPYAPAARAPAYGGYRPAYRALPTPPSYPPRAPAYPGYGYGSAYPRYPNSYPAYRAPYAARPSYAPGPSGGRWRRGQILPPAYRGEPINNYAAYHLRRPPRGYYWCRQGDDYVLVALTTGLIFEVIAGGY